MVPAGGVAQTAHEVRAIGQWHQAMCQGHGRATTRTAGAHVRIPGIARRTEHRVVGVRAQPQLGHIGLADDDAARGFHPRDDEAVDLGDGVREQGAALGRGKADGLGDILDRLRHAMHESLRDAARKLGISRVGLDQERIVRCEVDDGVQARVERVDSRQARLHHLAARDLAPMDGLRQSVCVEIGDRHGPAQAQARRGRGIGIRLSNALAARSTSASPNIGPTICSPIGKPACVKPQGIVQAGCWVRLKG